MRVPRILAAAALAVPLASLSLVGAQEPPKPGQVGGTYTGPGDTVPHGGTQPATPGANPGTATPGALPGNRPGTTAPGTLPGGGRPNPWGAGPPPPGSAGAAPLENEPDEPGSRPRVEDPASWRLWWHYNRWEFLAVDHEALQAQTGAEGFHLGRGARVQRDAHRRAKDTQIKDLVLPALAGALRETEGNELRIHGLQAMAKLNAIEPAEADDHLPILAAKLLNTGTASVLEKTILALGVHGDAEAFPRLHAVLHDETAGRAWLGRSRIGFRPRAFAAFGLGLLAEQSEDPRIRDFVHRSLLRALGDDRPEVQAAAAFSMGLVLLPHDEAEAYAGEEGQPGHIRVQQVLELLRFYNDPEQPTVARCQAPRSLALLLEGTPEALRERVVLSFLEDVVDRTDEPREIGAAAVIALGRIGRGGPEEIDVSIRKMLERIAFRSHQPRLTRYRAMISLARVATRPGLGEEPFADLDATRRLFRRNLSRHRGDALCWTALGLGLLESRAREHEEFPDADVPKVLRSLAEKARSSEVFGAAAIALGFLRDPDAESVLLERLRESGNADERAFAALALGMIGATHAIPDLRDHLEASIHQPATLEQTAIALALLGDQGTSARLQTLQKEASNPEAQAAIASALGWIKDPRPLEGMTERLADKTLGDSTRAWTAIALGRICDPADVPWVGRLSIDVPYEVRFTVLIEPEFKSGLLDLF